MPKRLLINGLFIFGAHGTQWVESSGGTPPTTPPTAPPTAPPADNMTYPDLKIYPNPYVKGISGGMKFAGLPGTEMTVLRIYTLSGKIVKEIAGSGAELNWDCRNSENMDIVSGLYVYVLCDESGMKIKTGKVVIR